MDPTCRICFEEPGTYNIFTDEFLFDSKPQKQTKIYIVLNNFLHEKLYSADEHSQLICTSCCNKLSESYSFMSKIRSSEQQLKTQQPISTAPPVIVTAIPTVPSIISSFEQQSKLHAQLDVIREDPTTEIIVETSDSPPESPQKVVHTNKRKKSAVKKSSDPLKSSAISYTHYELEQEAGQNVITVAIKQKLIELCERELEHFKFDVSYLNHADETIIYKCTYCIKGFSTSELLIKHTVISHLCVLCHRIFNNYKEMNLHLKEADIELECKICHENFNHSTYRQHLKTKHKLNPPVYIGIS